MFGLTYISFQVYITSLVSNMNNFPTLVYKDLIMTTEHNNSSVDADVAAWAAMSPEEKAAVSKELLRKILRASPPENIEAILKEVPLETSREILKDMCEELTEKPFPSSPFPSVSGDLVMDLVKNVGGPGFNKAHTAYHEAFTKATEVGKFPMSDTAKKIYAQCFALTGKIIADYTNAPLQMYGLATLNEGDKETVVALLHTNAFKLYPVVLDDQGLPRISASGVGSVVFSRFGISVEEGVVEHNQEQARMPSSKGTLNNVVKF